MISHITLINSSKSNNIMNLSKTYFISSPGNCNNELQSGSNTSSITAEKKIDVVEDDDEDKTPSTVPLVSETGRVSFPMKLFQILSKESNESIISWMRHGRAWIVHDTDKFEKELIPKYFKLTKFSSFTRQVNGWGFRRITKGMDKGGFYHELFLRGRSDMCAKMRRLKKKEGVDPFYALRDNNTGEVPPIHQTLQRNPMSRSIAAFANSSNPLQIQSLNVSHTDMNNNMLGTLARPLVPSPLFSTSHLMGGNTNTPLPSQGLLMRLGLHAHHVRPSASYLASQLEMERQMPVASNITQLALQTEHLRLQQAALITQQNAINDLMRAQLRTNQQQPNSRNYQTHASLVSQQNATNELASSQIQANHHHSNNRNDRKSGYPNLE